MRVTLLLMVAPWLGAVSAASTKGTMDTPQENMTVVHEVDHWEARNVGIELFRQEEPVRSGCTQCSIKDMEYCISEHLLKDHCCCDHNLGERYGYIPHVCYEEDVPLCSPAAGDCDQYYRLDVCCCQPFLRKEWEYHWWHTSPNAAPERHALALPTILLITTFSTINAIR